MFFIEDTGQWIDLKGVVVARDAQNVPLIYSFAALLHSAVFEEAIVGIEHFPGKYQKPFATEPTVVETALAIEDDPKPSKNNRSNQMKRLWYRKSVPCSQDFSIFDSHDRPKWCFHHIFSRNMKLDLRWRGSFRPWKSTAEDAIFRFVIARIGHRLEPRKEISTMTTGLALN